MGNPEIGVRDTGPMSSKKFLAYLVSEITSKMLLAGGLWVLKSHIDDAAVGLWWWMITLTICVTFLEVGAILGIAYVDRFVRVAQLTTDQNPFRKSEPVEPPQEK